MPKAAVHRRRLAALRRRLVDDDLDGFLLTDGAHVRYLVGYTGSNGLLVVGRDRADFLTDGRYREQAGQEVSTAEIHIVPGDLTNQLRVIRSLVRGRPRIGYPGEIIAEAAGQRMRTLLPKVFFVAVDDPVSPLMEVKDPGEVACIRRAAAIADHAFEGVLPAIRPGVSERDVAAELEYIMTRAGSEQPSFETIVASGPRAALPHGRASSRRLKRGDFVTLDFGATVDGYVSDLTRTVVVGKATARQKRIYELVRRAQRAAVARARAGVPCRTLDSVARGIITRAGYGKRFEHGLGHGIGLRIHEGPGVNARSKTILRPGMVITIEPGVYLRGWGGVRIEDDVLIGRRGATVLTTAERTLLEL